MDWLLSIPGVSHLLLAESAGMTFWEALPILANGILACLLTALVCAFLGVYVILRRVVFVSAALAQVSSLGVACAFLVGTWLGRPAALEAAPRGFAGAPGLTSLLFAAAAASLLSFQAKERRVTKESVLGIGYVLPGALVLLILDAISGETHTIENLLFGNTVFVPGILLVQLALATVLVFGVHAALHKGILFSSFDPESAQASGIRVTLHNQVFFLTLALTISISIGAIGALPVFGFMIVPAASALWLTGRLGWAFALSIAIGGASALIGFYLSFLYGWPTGPAMLATAGVFLVPGALRLTVARFSAG